jgi:hypothetical protein
VRLAEPLRAFNQPHPFALLDIKPCQLCADTYAEPAEAILAALACRMAMRSRALGGAIACFLLLSIGIPSCCLTSNHASCVLIRILNTLKPFLRR